VAVVSRHATQVFFCVFDATGKTELARFALPQRLGDVHYGFVAGLREGIRYGLRASGPWDLKAGHRFDPAKLLLDPYALALDGPFKHHAALTERGLETAALVPKAIVTHVAADALPLPLQRPGFIYEIPVKAFTKLHPGIPPEKRGTIAALAEPVIIDTCERLALIPSN
jgi:glycogen debranching enzyme